MELHVLHRHGWSIAALAREFGLSWRTARRYAAAEEAPRYRPRARPAELSPAEVAHVERRLAACPDLRATVLLRELHDEYGYLGSYASLRRRVRNFAAGENLIDLHPIGVAGRMTGRMKDRTPLVRIGHFYFGLTIPKISFDIHTASLYILGTETAALLREGSFDT